MSSLNFLSEHLVFGDFSLCCFKATLCMQTGSKKQCTHSKKMQNVTINVSKNTSEK